MPIGFIWARYRHEARKRHREKSLFSYNTTTPLLILPTYLRHVIAKNSAYETPSLADPIDLLEPVVGLSVRNVT